MDLKLLIIDDDLKLQRLLKAYFDDLGWQNISHLHGEGVSELMATTPVDLVLLDMMLPKKDGLEVLAEIRKFSQIPVLMLTARGEAMDKIVGLEAGADDYLPKPFEPRELQARIKAILRRSRKTEMIPEPDSAIQQKTIQYGNLELHPQKRCLKSPGSEASLNDSAYRLMHVFMNNPETILDRDHIMNLTHGRDFMGFERSIDVQISKLRQILNDLENHTVRIRTIWGEGYMLQDQVSS